MAAHFVRKLSAVSIILLLVAIAVFLTANRNTLEQPHRLIVSVPKASLSADNGSNSSAHLEHWLPDWYNVSDTESLLRNRVKIVRERCKSFRGDRNVWKTRPMLRLASSASLVYCCTAKAGSTFWRNVLQRMKSADEKKKGSKVKFTTVRNPWHRLVSTYIQKFEIVRDRALATHLGQFCPKRVGGKPSFKTFVKDCVIAEWRNHRYNIHWLPSSERCKICEPTNDFIVAVENMEAEANYILKMAGLADPATFFDNTRNETIRKNEKKKLSSSYQSYYVGMDAEDIKALQSIYAFDIYVLQYPQTPFVDFENS